MKVKKILAVVFTALLVLSAGFGVFASTSDMEHCDDGLPHEAVIQWNGVYCAKCHKCLNEF